MKKYLAFLLCACMLFALAACGSGGDRPPESAEPELPPLNGNYVSDYGTLVFNGDGRSVELTLSPDFAEFTGLPEESSDGTYVFLFRNEEWRRDKAESFRITVGETSYQFRQDLSQVGETILAIADPDFADGEPILFTLQENK